VVIGSFDKKISIFLSSMSDVLSLKIEYARSTCFHQYVDMLLIQQLNTCSATKVLFLAISLSTCVDLLVVTSMSWWGKELNVI
jgi:hypothetical protein